MASCKTPWLASELLIHINFKDNMSLYIFVTSISLTVTHFSQWNTFQFWISFPQLFIYFVIASFSKIYFSIYTWHTPPVHYWVFVSQTYDSSAKTHYFPFIWCDTVYLVNPQPTILIQASLIARMLQHIWTITPDFNALGLSAWYDFMSHPWTT